MKKLMFALGVALVACGSFGAIRAVTPMPVDRDWWRGRHEAKLKEAAANRPQVVFIGDSITHFFEEHAGKVVWERYFGEGNRRALNLGYSGDRTEHVLWRITEGKELDGYEAKVVVLMIGTNNAGQHTFEEEPPIDTILGIREIVKTIRAKQPTAKVVLCPIFACGRNFAWRNEIVNKEIWKYADGKNVFWCDFNSQFRTADGRLPHEVFYDQLHPTSYGYEIWAAAVLPYIDAALEGRTMPPHRFAAFVDANTYRVENISTALFPQTRICEPSPSRGYDWWSSRMLLKRNQIADSKGEIDAVFFGDSITHFWETYGKKQLAELEKTYSILDLGYGGDRTEQLIWRGSNGELDGYKAKMVMLMVGTNNRTEPKRTAEGIRKILDLIAERQPQAKVLLLPIFPRGENEADENRVRNGKINELIKRFADGEKVVWCDFGAKFLDEKGDTKAMMSDRLHPNAKGYQVWSDAIRPYLKKFCGK